LNDLDPDNLPTLAARSLTGRSVANGDWIAPLLLLEFSATDGRRLRLCDFASAGAGGSPYRSWLKVEGVEATEFSKSNPLRTGDARSANASAKERL
jgi:hypothetical protein